MLHITSRRRLVMPVIILAAAGAIAVWASYGEIRRMDQVRERVLQLCGEIGAGRDVSSFLGIAEPAVRERVTAALQSVCVTADAGSVLEVTVSSGDVAGIGRAGGRATHTAVIEAGGIELIGLRVEHRGDPEHIRILGYWIPELL